MLLLWVQLLAQGSPQSFDVNFKRTVTVCRVAFVFQGGFAGQVGTKPTCAVTPLAREGSRNLTACLSPNATPQDVKLQVSDDGKSWTAATSPPLHPRDVNEPQIRGQRLWFPSFAACTPDALLTHFLSHPHPLPPMPVSTRV